MLDFNNSHPILLTLYSGVVILAAIVGIVGCWCEFNNDYNDD